MNYSLEKITDVETCDSLLASAMKQKEKLESNRRKQGEWIGKFVEKMNTLNDKMTSVQSILEIMTRVCHSPA